jgi:hypothetical protein
VGASRRSLAERFLGKVQKTARHWFWTGAISGSGYGNIRVGSRFQGAHVVAWELLHGPVPDGLFVLHKCDIRHCVRCLFLGTAQDNSDDMVRKGRSAQGSRNGMHTTVTARRFGSANPASKLTPRQVAMLRALRKKGVPLKDLARRFCVAESTASRIANRKRWTSVSSTC